MDKPTRFPFDERDLLSHAGRVGGIACALLRDPHSRADLVQETFLRALRSSLRDPAALGGWLARTARNAAAEGRRSRAHREQREQVTARPEATRSTEELAERLEAIRAVLAALAALSEPGRSCVQRHYLEELSIAQIAKQDAVSQKTVRRHIDGALAQLRKALDQHYKGERPTWMALLLPLARSSQPTWLDSRPALPGLATVGALAASAVLAVAVGYRVLHGSQRNSSLLARSPSLPAEVLAREAVALAAADESRRQPTAMQPVELIVVREHGTVPVPGALLHVWPLPEDPTIVTKIEQWFRKGMLEEQTSQGSAEQLADERGLARLEVAPHGALVTARSGNAWGKAILWPSNTGRQRIELFQDADLLVRVVQPDYRPVAGARICLRSLGYGGEDYAETTSDRDGSATLRHAGYIKGRPEEPFQSSAQLAVEVMGAIDSHYRLEPEEIGQGVFLVQLDYEVGHLDVTLVDPASGEPLLETESVRIVSFDLPLRDGKGSLPIRVGSDLNPDLLRSNHLRLLEPKEVRPFEHAGERQSIVLAEVGAGAEPVHARIVGMLVDAEGKAVMGARLGLKAGPDEIPGEHALTDASGIFTFEIRNHPSEGARLDICLLSSDERELATCKEAIAYVEGMLLDVGRLRLGTLSVLCSGTVSLPDGRPAKNARVELWSEGLGQSLASWGYGGGFEEETDDQGRFSIPAGPKQKPGAAEATLIVSHPECGPAVVPIRLQQEDLVVRLPGTFRLEGRVLFHESIRGEDLWIEASPFPRDFEATEAWTWRTAAFTRTFLDRDGHFVLGGLGPGTYRLRLAYYGSQSYWNPYPASLHEMLLDLDEDGPTRNGDESLSIDLRGAYERVRYSFTDPDGVPRYGVCVGLSEGAAATTYDYADSRGIVDMLVRRDARVFLAQEPDAGAECSDYYYDELPASGGPHRWQLEARPILRFSLSPTPPSLPPGIRLDLLARTSEGDTGEGFWGALDTNGITQCLAPARDRFTATLYLSGSSHKVALGTPIVLPGPSLGGCAYALSAPSEAELAAGLAALREKLADD